jgi:hypothetical protein
MQHMFRRGAGMAGGSPERGCVQYWRSEKEKLVPLSAFAAELVFLISIFQQLAS